MVKKNKSVAPMKPEAVIQKGENMVKAIIGEVEGYDVEDARVMLFIIRDQLQTYLKEQMKEIFKKKGLKY